MVSAKLQCICSAVEQFLCNPITESGLEGLSEQVAAHSHIVQQAWGVPDLKPPQIYVQGLTEALSNLQHIVAPPIQNGLQLLHHLQMKANIVPTGCIR